MLGDEYKEMYPTDYKRHTPTKIALKDGFRGYQSESSDCVVEHCAHYPITIVLFYDADIYLNSIMRSLAVKILDVFLFKYEARFLEQDYRNMTP